MLTLVGSPPQAETRAEFAERSVAKLEKTIDDLEGMNQPCFRMTTRFAMIVFTGALCFSEVHGGCPVDTF